jgi:hypothetical protein
MITTTNTGATNVTAAELARLGRDLSSVGEIDTELVRRHGPSIRLFRTRRPGL